MIDAVDLGGGFLLERLADLRLALLRPGSGLRFIESLPAIGRRLAVDVRKLVFKRRMADGGDLREHVRLEILVDARPLLLQVGVGERGVRAGLPVLFRLPLRLVQRSLKLAVREGKETLLKLFTGFGSRLDRGGIRPGCPGILLLGAAVLPQGLLRLARGFLFLLERLIRLFPVLEFLRARAKLIGAERAGNGAANRADTRADTGHETSRHGSRARADKSAAQDIFHAAVTRKRPDVRERFLDGLRVNAEVAHGVHDAPDDILGGLRKRSHDASEFLDGRLVLTDAPDKVLETADDRGHEVLRHGQQRRAEREPELARLHLHLAPLEIGRMRLLRIQQARGLDMRGNLHEIVVLLEHGDERGSARAEHLGGEGLFLSGRRGVLVALRQLRELLVERQELSTFVRQRDAEARERLGHIVSILPGGRHLLVEAREERNDAVDARARQRKDAAELRGLRTRRVKPLRQAVDVLPGLHRVVRDVKKPRARRADGEKRRRLGRKQGEAAGKAGDAAFGGI